MFFSIPMEMVVSLKKCLFVLFCFVLFCFVLFCFVFCFFLSEVSVNTSFCLNFA